MQKYQDFFNEWALHFHLFNFMKYWWYFHFPKIKGHKSLGVLLYGTLRLWFLKNKWDIFPPLLSCHICWATAWWHIMVRYVSSDIQTTVRRQIGRKLIRLKRGDAGCILGNKISNFFPLKGQQQSRSYWRIIVFPRISDLLEAYSIFWRRP